MYLSISEPGFVLQITQLPLIAQNWFCIQNLHMDLSFQKEKRIRNPYIDFGVIKQTNIVTFFFKHPVVDLVWLYKASIQNLSFIDNL